jgi:O-antigen/teichoic acid export membrane protein
VAIQVSYLGLFGFNYTLLIYGQKYPPGHKARGTFLTITAVIPLVFALIVSASYFFFGNYLELIYTKGYDAEMMRQYLVLFPILTFLMVGIGWLEGYLQSLHKTALQNFAREILSRIVYIVLIILYAFQVISFSAFIWLFTILYIIPFLFLLFIAMRSNGFHFEYRRNLFSIKELKEIFRFSGYHMLTVVSSVLILQLDAVLLAPLDKDGFEAVAVYSVATLAISMLRNPTRVIGIAATPAFTKSYNEGNLKELKDLFTRSAINMQVIGVGMFALVYLNIDNIQAVMAMIQQGYGQIKLLIMILMLGQLVEMVTGLNFELIGVTRYYRFNFWIALVLLLIVFVLNFFLIKEIGIYGAAWATTIGLVVFNISKTIFLLAKLKMQPFSRGTVIVFLSGAAAATAAWILPFLWNVYFDVMIRSCVFGALFWLFLYKSGGIGRAQRYYRQYPEKTQILLADSKGHKKSPVTIVTGLT